MNNWTYIRVITTTLNDQNHILENCIGSVIYFFILTQVPFVYMERAGFMTCTAANHQGGDQRARSFTFHEVWDTPGLHPGLHIHQLCLDQSALWCLSICGILKSFLNERSLFTFTFDFTITCTLCKGNTSYKIRYVSMSSGSVEQQIFHHGLDSHLFLLSTRDQWNLTPAARVGCRVVKSEFFFHGIGLLLILAVGWFFPPWVKGLKLCINCTLPMINCAICQVLWRRATGRKHLSCVYYECA